MSLLEPVQSLPRAKAKKATAADARAIAGTLAAAFFQDPVIQWAWPDPERRLQILPDFFEVMVTMSMGYDSVYATDDLTGAALWVPPTTQEPTEEEVEAFEDSIRSVTGEFAPLVLQLFATLDEQHPHEPHFYLPIIGTSPEHQGQGLGTALLAPVLEQCDREQMPAYLEATSERNQALYRRAGFRNMGQIVLPDGPPLWPMWRQPRSGQASPTGPLPGKPVGRPATKVRNTVLHPIVDAG